MNTIGRGIALRDPDFVLLPKLVRNKIQTSVLLYLFRSIGAAELSTVLKTTLGWTGQNCIDYRKELKASGYLMKNYKLYFYNKVVGQGHKPEGFGVKKADVLLAGRIIRSNTKESLKLVKHCLLLQAQGYKARSLDNFDLGLSKALERISDDAYIEKFIGKKFRFLTATGQRDKESLRSEMIEYALHSAYLAYPQIDSLLHLSNIMKTGIKNRGQNIILEETTLKRNRVVKNADGTFSGILMSMNYTNFEQTFAEAGGARLNTCNALMSGLDGQSCENERPSDVDRRRDLQQAVNVLMTSTDHEVQRRFMTLLMGDHDKDFSDYLGLPNEEAIYKLPRKTYADKARRFLKVKRDQAREFVLEWRSKLADFRN